MAGKKKITLAQVDQHMKEKYGDTGDPNANALRPSVFYGTGIPRIDYVLGGSSGEMGGLPAGHITEIYGAQAVGKTSLVYRMLAHAQKTHPEKLHVIFDYEHTTDKNYIQKCGVRFDLGTLRIFRPATIEQGIDRMMLLHATGMLGVVVFDSLAAMMPKADLEKRQKSLDDNQGVASKARVMSEMMRFIISEIAGSDTALAFINHEIDNIRPAFSGYAPAKTTPGGNALKYYTSMRLELLYKSAVTSDKKTTFEGDAYKGSVGKTIQLHVEKFKFGNPGGRVFYELRHGEGIDIVTPVLHYGLKTGDFQKKGATKGATYTITGVEGAFRGEENFRAYLAANPAVCQPVFDKMITDTSALSSPDEAEDSAVEIPEIEEIDLND